MYKDYLGNEINVGDPVVMTEINYRNFIKGTITKLTEKTVWIEHRRGGGCSGNEVTKQKHNQVIKLFS
jgi:hypothetical protein